MTDQLWEGEDGTLSKKLIGRISNMKQFWNGVSDDGSGFEKRRGGKIQNRDRFSECHLSHDNLKKRRERFAAMAEAEYKCPIPKAYTPDMLEDIDVKRKLKCEKGNAKEQLSFWEGVLEEQGNGHERVNDNIFRGKDSQSVEKIYND